MPEAYIVAAARTAGGRKGGALRDWHPADMAAEVLDALVERAGIDPAAVEDVIMGCVGQAGEQAFHIGRNAVLASSLPISRPRRHHRPPVRLLAAGDPVRRPGGDERHPGRGHRRRGRIDDPGADGPARHPPDAARHRHRPVLEANPGAVRSSDVQPVRRRRDDRREISVPEGGARRLRARQPPQGGAGDRGGRVRRGDRAAEDRRRRGQRDPPRQGRGHTLRRHPRRHRLGEAAQGRRQDQRRQRLADLRRRRGRDGRLASAR